MDYKEKLFEVQNNSTIKLKDIEKIISMEKSLDEIQDFHGFLIDKIIKITEDEESKINTDLCKNNLSFNYIKDKFENGKSGCGIYFFNTNEGEIFVFGDLHGDSITLRKYIEKINFLSRIQSGGKLSLIFLGDYVDRGKAMFKTLEFLFILKYLFPKNIFLLRGNHDGGKIISNNEYKLCVGRNSNTTDDDYFTAMLFNRLKKEGKSLSMLQKYHDFFNILSNFAVIYDKEIYFLTHGGIPRPQNHKFPYLSSLSCLTNPEIKDEFGDSPFYNMMWSDPGKISYENTGKRRFYFYKKDFDEFCRLTQIDKIVRGHEAFEKGTEKFFNNKLITIFSSGSIPNTENNETAYKDIFPCYYHIKNGGRIMR